jgi:DNA-binding beta-propeller fold protein YncE
MLLVALGHENARAQEATGPREQGAVAYLILHKAGSALGFYDRSGRLVDSVPVGTHPHEMVLAPDGRHVYVADNGVMLLTDSGSGGNTVSIVDIPNRKRVGVIGLDHFRRPHGISLDRQTGRLFVTTELPDRLLMLDPAARQVVRDGGDRSPER